MEDDFKHLVRISRKDVDGNKKIEQALTEIKGVGLSLSRSICLILGLNVEEKSVILLMKILLKSKRF